MAVRQREYETVYLLRPDANDDDLSDARGRIENTVDDADGNILKFTDWGRRETAYEVRDDAEGRNFDQARYQYVRYVVPGSAVQEIERQLKLAEPVLKYLTVKLDEDVDPEQRSEEPVEENTEALPYENLEG